MSIVEAEQQTAPVSVTVSVGGKEITFETGKLAKQADGAVVLRNAPHPEAAHAWVAFLNSPEAQSVYREFGFGAAK